MVFMYFITYFLCIFVYFLFLHCVFICVPSCTNFIINKKRLATGRGAYSAPHEFKGTDSRQEIVGREGTRGNESL